MTQTGQYASLHPAADRPEVQAPGPASQKSSSGRSEFLPPDPTGLPTTVSRRRSSVPAGATVSVEDPVPEGGYVSDRASSQADEGEVSDLDSTGLDQQMLDVDQELSARNRPTEKLSEVLGLLWPGMTFRNLTLHLPRKMITHLPALKHVTPGKCL